MLFSSIPFLYYFLPAVIFTYFIVPFKLKNIVLLISSLFFYAWGEPSFILIMISSSLSAYIFGLLINKYREKNKKLSKILMIVSVSITFLFLVIFKYADFIVDNINSIFKSAIPLLKLALPLGISFYTFQIASYTIDLYRGEINVQKNPFKLMTYISMFPQLIAGPIVRYSDVEKEINNRSTTIDDISYGIRRFVIGLSKKVLIANILGEFCDIAKFNNDMSIVFMWLYVIAYALQIYFDFSGYSDMAIGLGKIFGFNFPENFNYPYISKSITEFWRRWHMTLSSWFKDYVYIPLGGNRVSKLKWFRNILLVWAFTGLWHGASWNFVIWGLFFAVLLIAEKLFLLNILKRIPSIFSRIYTIFFVLISWLIFDSTSLKDIFNFLLVMFGFANVPFINNTTIYYLDSYLVLFIIAIIGATPFMKQLVEKMRQKNVLNMIINILEIIILMLLLIVSTAYLIDGSFNPFLYFRF